MTHSIVLEIPESIYQPLAEEAETKGRKIEEIALEKLAEAAPKQTVDSLDNFVGAFSSDVADWANKHDEYIGEKLAEDLTVKR